MKKIVLTGGPCAGKSTALERLKKIFGERVMVVPEAATMLMAGGFPKPGRDLSWSPEWQRHLQNAVFPLQCTLEDACELAAREKGAEILICDRGLLDGAAYTPGGLPAFLETFGVDEGGAHGRYARVIHLESVAVCNPALYGNIGNEVRFETQEEAAALDAKTAATWQNHPNWQLVPGCCGIEVVLEAVIAAVAEELALPPVLPAKALHPDVPAPAPRMA